uniref:Fc receptor, IgE, high affinity I, gamma polypeptide like n=1 Tax=Pundamilia nyererei TaxID=303518 RepID=A0A3B4F0W7_9CICH
MDICFILDGILILYGIILTVLYCRLRYVCLSACILQGLTTQSTDTYETIRLDKKPIV